MQLLRRLLQRYEVCAIAIFARTGY